MEAVNNKFIQELSEILEVNSEEYNRLEIENQKKREYLLKQDNDIKELSAQIDVSYYE